MLVQDFVSKLDDIYFMIKNEKYLDFSEEGFEKYKNLRSFMGSVWLRARYVYAYTEGLDENGCFVSKYVLVPNRCTWAADLEDYIRDDDYIKIPEEYYDFIEFCGVHFPHCFILDKLKEEKLCEK